MVFSAAAEEFHNQSQQQQQDQDQHPGSSLGFRVGFHGLAFGVHGLGRNGLIWKLRENEASPLCYTQDFGVDCFLPPYGLPPLLIVA